ncbi:MAG TPA: multicopper oxidase domain-containing protein, partial [Mycobacteriales bacterium]|nr:multicopper oxidase domain-containing protein [Mycobacteriales bacterium]
MTRERRRLLAAVLASLTLVAPLAWLWQDSLVPGTYDVMDMGYHDYGGGPVAAGHDGHGGRSVEELVAPDGAADVRVTLTARQERFRLPSGVEVDGYTVNGTSPGPTIRAVEGQLLEVTLVNQSVADGVTLHWHGVDVPNAADGVAGVTQDAVAVGESYVYRFRVERGSYWYHSHQVSHEQVRRGLFGALVVVPEAPEQRAQDELALLHVYDGTATLNGRTGDVEVPARRGSTVRVRVVNTDNAATPVWA